MRVMTSPVCLAALSATTSVRFDETSHCRIRSEPVERSHPTTTRSRPCQDFFTVWIDAHRAKLKQLRYTTRQVPINRDLGQVIAAVKAGRAVVPFWCNVPRLIVNIVPMKLTLLVLSSLKEMSPQYVSY